MHCRVLRKSSRNSASTAEEQGRLDSATDTVEIEMETLPAALADNTTERFHSPLKLSTKDSRTSAAVRWEKLGASTSREWDLSSSAAQIRRRRAQDVADTTDNLRAVFCIRFVRIGCRCVRCHLADALDGFMIRLHTNRDKSNAGTHAIELMTPMMG